MEKRVAGRSSLTLVSRFLAFCLRCFPTQYSQYSRLYGLIDPSPSLRGCSDRVETSRLGQARPRFPAGLRLQRQPQAGERDPPAPEHRKRRQRSLPPAPLRARRASLTRSHSADRSTFPTLSYSQCPARLAQRLARTRRVKKRVAYIAERASHTRPETRGGMATTSNGSAAAASAGATPNISRPAAPSAATGAPQPSRPQKSEQRREGGRTVGGDGAGTRHHHREEPAMVGPWRIGKTVGEGSSGAFSALRAKGSYCTLLTPTRTLRTRQTRQA